MKVEISDKVPDSTSFSMRHVTPVLNGNTITILNGSGTRRSWGKPTVTSTVVLKGRNLIALHVGFYHKHGGGQGWHYFHKNEKGNWQKVTWSQLNDSDRKKVIKSYNKKCDYWVSAPGKLKSERATLAKEVAYKIVRKEGNQYFSLFNSSVEYCIGKRLVEKAQENHNGGYYSYPNLKWLKEAWEKGEVVSKKLLESITTVAILECEVSGNRIAYDNGKISTSYLVPLKEIEEMGVPEHV